MYIKLCAINSENLKTVRQLSSPLQQQMVQISVHVRLLLINKTIFKRVEHVPANRQARNQCGNLKSENTISMFYNKID